MAEHDEELEGSVDLADPVAVEKERRRRWRLVLGEKLPDDPPLSTVDQAIDRALAQLYDAAVWRGEGGGRVGGDRRGGLGSSSPQISRWLGDIRTYFPASVVQLMQKDAFERLGLHQMLLEPELLDQVVPDVHLVATLMTLGRVMPQSTKETARLVVRKVVNELESRLKQKTVAAVRGALNRAQRTRRPRSAAEVDWDRTLRANLHSYDPERQTVIAEKLIGHSRKQRRGHTLRDIVLCVDQSGSMGSSVVYSGIFGAVLASLRAVSTRIVFFDTAVVDMGEEIEDPVDVLFGAQLGGGTDINRALTYCQQIIQRPAQSILVLITDLIEGGDGRRMLARAAELHAAGVVVVCLLALSDDGAPSFDAQNAAYLADIGIPTFACTPDLFPDLMAAAIEKRDLGQWAARHDITLAKKLD